MSKNTTKEEIKKLEKEYKNELGPDHTCYIYKITNLANGKMYIGLTTISIESRWKGHLFDAKKKTNKRPLYQAIRKYGVENFTIECIEECTLKEVQSREQHWIKYYNTFLDKTKGYNCSPGGELGLITKDDEDMIIKAYKKLKTLQKVSDELNIDPSRAKSILIKNGIEVKTAMQHQKEKGYSIYQYDNKNDLINIFQSKYEAGQWLIENGFSNAKNNRNAGDTLRRYLMLDKHFVYGYYWYFDDKVPTESKEKYAKRTKEQKRNNEKEYRKSEKYIQQHKDKCPHCNNLKEKTSKLCKKCRTLEQHKESKIQLINRNKLKSLIRTSSFSEIGRTYDVDGNTIKKWCKLHDLPFRKLDIDKISDKDWESENWNLENIEEFQIKHHKKIIPEYNQLKIDLYNLGKTELIEKYDYSCIKYFNEMVKNFGLLTDKEIIQKFTFDEWIEEKWKDKSFYDYVFKNRYLAKYPERNWFKKEIRIRSFKDISSDFNVDKSTIKKILIYFNIPYYREDVLSYTDEEWESEIWNNTPSTTEKEGQVDE